jgi:hypothetical protein
VPAPWEGLLWGTLPIGTSILAILFALLLPEKTSAPGELLTMPSYDRERVFANEVHS